MLEARMKRGNFVIPNIDPKTLKSMMDRLGIKSSNVDAQKVTIELPDKYLIVDNPQVLQIEAQGVKSFQITGNISEISKQQQPVEIEISDEDVNFVMEQAGITDPIKARRALEEAQGDIALAISFLKKSSK
ncbi:MAG: nascent polypeptide-associated complex protein [Candidatus Micrarchaeaceae archaeon]